MNYLSNLSQSLRNVTIGMTTRSFYIAETKLTILVKILKVFKR